MAEDIMNAASSPKISYYQENSIRPDRSGSKPNPVKDAPTDDQLAAQARERKAKGDNAGAKTSIAQMRDKDKQRQTYNEMYGDQKKGADSPPPTLMRDGSGGLEDPLALFFMMVFYLNKATPTFRWSDVLKTAASFSNQKFSNIDTSGGELPQRNYSDSGTATAGTGSRGQLDAQTSVAGEGLKKEHETKVKNLNTQRDTEDKKLKTQMGSSGGGKGGDGGPVVIWPVQCMPVINSGLNKTVDWPTGQVTTFAEPTIALNKGASAIEIDIEFTYGVGVYGVGDAEITAMTGQVDPFTGQPGAKTELPQPPDSKGKWWTIEEVMGMMYLATSLIYPYKSSKVVSSPEKPASDADRAGGQFPVVFLRHYSLFPFLTPFVVKGVKIEPDENQPLVITEPVRLNKEFETHLSYPAVRQIVKITLSLISAHYYLPIFGGKDDKDQIMKQTSGETYLKLSKSLLKERIP